MKCSKDALLELYDLTQFLKLEGIDVKQLYPSLKIFLDYLDVFVKDTSEQTDILIKLEERNFACKRIKHIFGIDLYREGDFPMTKNEWINNVVTNHPKADKKILQFIANFAFYDNDNFRKNLSTLFSEGYCLHFANMLKTTFEEGEVCLAYPDYHIVWYNKGVSYDIKGVNTEYSKLIPVKYLDDYVIDFKHIPNEQADESVKTLARHLEELIDAGKFIV